MKWFLGILSLIVVTAVTIVVTAAIDSPVRKAFASKPLQVDIYPNYWQPFPQGKVSDPQILLKDSPWNEKGIRGVTSEENRSFVVIILKNRTYKSLKDVQVELKEPYQITIGVLQFPDGTRKILKEKGELLIEEIPPSKSVKIYVWSSIDLGGNFAYSEARFFTEDGAVKARVHQIEGAEISEYPEWYQFFMKSAPYLLFILLVMLAGLGFLVASEFMKYMKKLFASEDVYIAEKIRHDANPEKFVIDTKL